MIQVTRLNGMKFWVSADQVEFIEATPDTVLSLLTGKKLVILEKPADVIDRIVAFRQRIFRGPEILVDKQGKET